jgi:Tfp pilus tip-associated adhesin PilY1
MVTFGTGKYLEKVDLTSKTLQAVYAVHDRGEYNKTKTVLARRYLTETSVVQVDDQGTPTGDPNVINRKVQGDSVDWKNQFGWYMNLASSSVDQFGNLESEVEKGERLVYRPFIAGRLFVFNTLTPEVDACSGGSTGFTMLVDWTSGLAPPFSTYDSNGDGIESSDEGYIGYKNSKAGSQLGRLGDAIVGSKGDDSEIREAVFGTFINGRRLGWEEKHQKISN